MSPIGDNEAVEVERTLEFTRWLEGLRDRRGAMKISTRIDRLAAGHWGDVKPIGGGLSELRIHHGPGYRLYLAQKGPVWVILLCGGDKGSQARDIAEAQRIWKSLNRDT
jgi:putative addiction module killer protein